MRKALGLILVIFMVVPAFAEAELSGRIKLFSSLFLSENQQGEFFSHEAGEFAFKRVEFRLKVQGDVSDNISYGARLDAFSGPDAFFNSGYFPESGPLASPVREEPFEFNLYEAYIKVSDFLIKNLDFTVGKQRISWGTADKVNVVDNLNPIDFANFLTFDPDYFNERRPQTAFNFEYYIGNETKLQAVWLISRQYSPLPSGFTYLSGRQFGARVSIDQEKALLKNTNFGFRASTVVFNTDIALSWYHGNFHLPVLYGVESAKEFPELHYSYPELDVLGVSFSGELASVGFWGEVAYYIPGDINGMLRLGMGPTIGFDVFESGYFKYVFGMDYTIGIGNGIYVNAQFLHGFFDERDYSPEAEQFLGFKKGQFFGEIENYVIARMEYKMLGDSVKLSLGGFVELGEGTSYALMPGLEIRVKDALTVEAGTFAVFGDRNTKFGAFKDDKIGFVALKLDF